MREGKPFVSNGDIKVNLGSKLYSAKEIIFYDINGNILQRKDACLDTEHRVAGIIVNKKGEILLLEISNPKHFFCFPGGHQRECETEKDCLRREMLEETGIKIIGSKITLLLKMQEPGFGPETFYLIDIGNKEIVYKDENSEDIKSRLSIYKIIQVLNFKNIFPIKVLNELKEIYQTDNKIRYNN